MTIILFCKSTHYFQNGKKNGHIIWTINRNDVNLAIVTAQVDTLEDNGYQCIKIIINKLKTAKK